MKKPLIAITLAIVAGGMVFTGGSFIDTATSDQVASPTSQVPSEVTLTDITSPETAATVDESLVSRSSSTIGTVPRNATSTAQDAENNGEPTAVSNLMVKRSTTTSTTLTVRSLLTTSSTSKSTTATTSVAQAAKAPLTTTVPTTTVVRVVTTKESTTTTRVTPTTQKATATTKAPTTTAVPTTKAPTTTSAPTTTVVLTANERLVTNLYKGLLNRSDSSHHFDWWVTEFSNGSDRMHNVRRFIDAANLEKPTPNIRAVYIRINGVTPSPAKLASLENMAFHDAVYSLAK